MVLFVFFENEERFFDELLLLTATAALDVLPIFASCSLLRLSGAISLFS